MTTLELWQSGLALAKHMARQRARIAAPLLGTCSDDFQQAALLALWQAAQNYKVGCGSTFTSFAWHHIRGELNCERWRQEVLGFKAGKAQAYNKVTNLPKRSPLDNLPEERLFQVSSESLYDDKELLDWMIKQLQPVKAQVVARRFWLEGLSTATIAHQLAVSVTRVEQIRAKARHDLQALASTLQKEWQEE